MLREDARVPIEHLWANDSIQEVCQLSRALNRHTALHYCTVRA
jgi:hypothetical protein